MRVVVLAGGLSDERDVSLVSGSLIANALASKGYEVALLDLSKNLDTLDFEKLFSKEQRIYDFKISEKNPEINKEKRKIGKNVLECLKYADIVFNALHGSIGENGELQEIFDRLGIKYTGTGPIGSKIAMNKEMTKKILINNNILVPQIFDSTNFAFPVIVKPANNGSSIGVSIVHDSKQLEEAIKKVEEIDSKVIIEEYINGREFSVAILDNKALPIIEIKPKVGFYDYKNKYQEGLTEEICPADLDEEKTREIQDIALKVHHVLKLGTYSRIDFIMSSKGDIYCLEANTLPGMTPVSLMPQEAKAAGIGYENLCEIILKLSLNSLKK